MVRTADTSLRISSGKASRKGTNVAVQSNHDINSSPSTSEKGTGGLNPICHWATPKWQKSITEFFKNKPLEKKKTAGPLEDAEASTSIPTSSSKINEEILNHSDKENLEPSSFNNSITMDVEMNEETRGTKRAAEDEVLKNEYKKLCPWKKVKLTEEVIKHLEEMEK